MKKVEAYFVVPSRIFWGAIAIGVTLVIIGLILILFGNVNYGITIMGLAVLFTILALILTIICAGKVYFKIEPN